MDNKLPNTLHELLNVAIDDMEYCLNSGRHSFLHSVWHRPAYMADGVCQICVAGAVMSRTLGVNPDLNFNPEMFDNSSVCHKLEALEYIRNGQFETAHAFMQFANTDTYNSQCHVKGELTREQLNDLGYIYKCHCDEYYEFMTNDEVHDLVIGFKKLASAMQEMGI